VAGRIDRLGGLIASKDSAIGEVASVEGEAFEVFVYPECYPRVHVGDIVIVDSGDEKAVGVVSRLSHRSRLGSFTPLHRTRSEIREAYPDIESYYLFTLTVTYTSHFNGREIVHMRGAMPKLHDLVYLIEDDELIRMFFDAGFDFLLYYVEGGAGPLEVRELLHRHSNVLMSVPPAELFENIARVLLRCWSQNVSAYLEEAGRVIMGW